MIVNESKDVEDFVRNEYEVVDFHPPPKHTSNVVAFKLIMPTMLYSQNQMTQLRLCGMNNPAQ